VEGGRGRGGLSKWVCEDTAHTMREIRKWTRRGVAIGTASPVTIGAAEGEMGVRNAQRTPSTPASD